MKPPMPGYFQELLAERSGPCISIYAPTVRLGRPQGSENDRMFSGLVQRAEQELRQRYPAHHTDLLVQPLRRLLDDQSFWEQPADGIAAFAAPDFFYVQKLDRSVPEQVTVADSFHLKPLIRAQQFTGKYQVWQDCGGTTNDVVTLVAVPADASYLAVIQAQIVTDADLEALQKAFDTFNTV